MTLPRHGSVPASSRIRAERAREPFTLRHKRARARRGPRGGTWRLAERHRAGRSGDPAGKRLGTSSARLQSRHGPSGLLRRPLDALRRRPGARDVPARRAPGALRRRPAAVHPARPARERAAPRGRRRPSPRGTSRRSRAGTRRRRRRSEINFNPARVLLQDFTGVPAVVDLAAMRAAMADLGGDPQKINPLIPVELVIDHSVQVDDFATRFSIARNSELEFTRNRERYAFLRWGQGAFAQLQGRAAEHRASATRSTSSSSRASSRSATARRSPTRSSAPTRTRRWSTGSACSAGASAGSRPRRRCSARRSRCSCRRSSASGSTARCPRARRRPTSSSR